MNASEKKEILRKFKIWFKEELIEKHKANTLKLVKLKNFKIIELPTKKIFHNPKSGVKD